GFRVGEISCPALYEEDSSSIGLRRSIVYGFGVLGTALRFRAARWGLRRASPPRRAPARAAERGRRRPLQSAAMATAQAPESDRERFRRLWRQVRDLEGARQLLEWDQETY